MTATVRLSFWVKPDRLGEFEMTPMARLVATLDKCGYRATGQVRPGGHGVTSLLIDTASPSDIVAMEQTLQLDENWQNLLRDLAAEFGTSGMPDLTAHRFNAIPRDEAVPPPDPSILSHRISLNAADAGSGVSQGETVGFRVGSWHSFSVPDGLIDSAISSICEDRSGHVWFAGKAGGICRFDGAAFRRYGLDEGLACTAFWTVFADRDGVIWFGTRTEGVIRYDGHRFTNLTVEDGLPGNDVRAIAQDQTGDLWFGIYGGGLGRYDGERCVQLSSRDGLVGDDVVGAAADHTGRLWVASQRCGVSCYEDGSFISYTATEGLESDRLTGVAEGRDGCLWFVTGGDGVFRFDGTAFRGFTSADGLADDHVLTVWADSEGYLWFGTYGRGVSRFGADGFVTFGTADGLAGSVVTALRGDRAGRLWVGTRGGSVSRYDNTLIRTFAERDGLDHTWVQSLAEDRDGHLWLATLDGGIYRLEGQSFVNLTHVAWDVEPCRIQCIHVDRHGVLWFATAGCGALRFDGVAWTRLGTADGLTSDNVVSIVEDGEGLLWFATADAGVSRFDSGDFENFGCTEGLPHSQIRCAAVDREGRPWFGTSGGVCRFDDGRFVESPIEDGLPPHWISFILADHKGHMWYGRGKGGITRFDGHTWQTFTTQDGLSHNRMNCALADNRHHLWFGSQSGGVTRFDGLVFQPMGHEDGLVHSEISQILQTKSGDYWMATIGGATRYLAMQNEPTVQLRDVIADRSYGAVDEVDISMPGHLTFEFAAVSTTTRPGGMSYVVHLIGHEQEPWVTRTPRVEYEDLPLGEYVFRVEAIDRDLNRSTPLEIRVTIVLDPHIEALNQAVGATDATGDFVGNSPALQETLTQLAHVSSTDVTVLIAGETGTGKGLAARRLHGASRRRRGPFIPVNCGAIPENLVESELFGHERGAFTGAATRKRGKVELAQGGSLFLDEIGDLPMAAQVKILRFLDDHTFERVGGTETLNADVRIIAATNRNLEEMVVEGRFREDLLYRLRVFPVRLPPLRHRRGDIASLAVYFMRAMALHLHKPVRRILPEALAVLESHRWPGNVRELEHCLQRAVIVCVGEVIGPGDLALGQESGSVNAGDDRMSLAEVECHYIMRALERCNWVIGGPKGAAAALGLNESTLRGRMRKHGIHRSGRHI